MDRRLFLGQSFAGLAVHLIPLSLSAKSFLSRPATGTKSERVVQEIAEALKQGKIGHIEQLYISHIYNPKQTLHSAIMAQVQCDVEQTGHLIGLSALPDVQSLLVDSPSATFGTHSTQFVVNGTAITCQTLAYIGNESYKPKASLRILGNKGMLVMNPDYTGYQLINFKEYVA